MPTLNDKNVIATAKETLRGFHSLWRFFPEDLSFYNNHLFSSP